MAAAARASQPGYTGRTIYVSDEAWQQLRQQALDLGGGVTASSLGAALIEHYLGGELDPAAVEARAREISQGRRRRSD